jgi:Tat protein translocase TatB subunit
VFDIGMPEFVLIAIVALLVLGPERLPEVMGKVGRAYRQLRQMSSELTGEFQRQFEEGMREVEEVSSTIRETWQGATSDGDAPAGPPPRLLQLPPPLLAPETAAGAGPWTLAAPQRDTPAEPEPRAAVYPEAPFVLPRRAPAPELDFDDLAAGGPALMGPAPTDAEVAAIGEAFEGGNVLTASASPTIVKKGVVLGFDLVSGRAKLLIDLKQAAKQRVVFGPDILGLMAVTP